MQTKLVSRMLLAMVLAAGAFALSCSRDSSNINPANNNTTASSTPAATPKTGFEADLDYVRKGQYTYVWVFSRKDGKALDKDDAAELRKQAPQVVDWVTSEEGRKVIAGTNFDLELGNLNELRKRFVVENYTGK